MTAEERREQIIDAAARVFGERGYDGGTTDAIAKEAGISQAYVVRMFGSKEELFIAVGARASLAIATGFRAALGVLPANATQQEKMSALGDTYADLLGDRGQVLALLHLFAQGQDEVLGPFARECYITVYKIVREEAGLSIEDAVAFFSHGMLMTVLQAMRLSETEDPMGVELLHGTLGHKAPQLIAQSHTLLPLADARRGR